MINTATLAREAPSNRMPGRSRLTAALRAPWLATSRANVWISAAAFAVCALGASAIGWLLPDRHGTGLALFVYAFGVAFWWAFCMASLLLLAPHMRKANLKRAAQILWVIPLTGLAVLPGLTEHHHLAYGEWVGAAALAGIGWLVLFTSLMTPLVAIGLLQRRWSRGGELALLALLPGLTRHAPAYASVARATLVKPVVVQAIAALLVLTVLLAKHVSVAPVFLALLFFSLIVVVTAWASLRIMGGRPAKTGLLISLAVVALVLVAGGTPLVIAFAKAGAVCTTVVWCVDAALLILCAAFAWFARRAWQVFCQRPHPFLANAR